MAEGEGTKPNIISKDLALDSDESYNTKRYGEHSFELLAGEVGNPDGGNITSLAGNMIKKCRVEEPYLGSCSGEKVTGSPVNLPSRPSEVYNNPDQSLKPGENDIPVIRGADIASTMVTIQRFNKKVSVTLQHCASADDPTFSFMTANCRQPTLPYTFKPISPGAVNESDSATIQVDHFSAITATASSVAYFEFHSYYNTIIPNSIYDVRITAIKNVKLHVEEVKKEYESWESGPYAITHITAESVSLSVPEVSGVPEETWEKDGWRITPVVKPLTLKKELIEAHEVGQSIPCFAFKLELKDPNHPSPLVQNVNFTGVNPPVSIILTRDPPPDFQISATRNNQQQSASPTLNTGDLFDVISELESVEARWKYIGLALRLDPNTLEGIGKDYKEWGDCLIEVLILWLKKHYDYQRFGEPSWELLAEAVGHPSGGNDTVLAEEIRTRHCSTNHTS